MTVHGDSTGLGLPATPDELQIAGATFLTRALRAGATVASDNAVTAVTGFVAVAGGSTGCKAQLSVEYARPGPGLPTELFAKFSRDLDDPARDVGRVQMEPEVRFAELSRVPGFPITIPQALFADFHRESGTGLLITERIGFGTNGIEPQLHKCLDYEMPDAVGHYRTLIAALARLAGWHRSGGAPAALLAGFPVDLQAATVGERPPLRADRLTRQLQRLAEFAGTHPGLLPANVRTPQFLSALAEHIPQVVDRESAVWNRLANTGEYIALCHWNANVDNAWFWRDEDGTLHCGLMDWGCVSQLNVAMALWGALSAAETTLWDQHFDELAGLFAAEYAAAGGPPVEVGELIRQTPLYATVMAATWLLDVPGLIRARLGAAARDMTRFDAPIRDDESLRAPLQMLVNVLNIWQTRDVAGLLGQF